MVCLAGRLCSICTYELQVLIPDFRADYATLAVSPLPLAQSLGYVVPCRLVSWYIRCYMFPVGATPDPMAPHAAEASVVFVVTAGPLLWLAVVCIDQ